MAKLLVCFYSRTGHTEKMAEAVAQGARRIENLDVEVKPISQIEPNNLLDYEAIIMGSPTYYGTMASELKHLIDESVAFHGQLAGKVFFLSCDDNQYISR